jgi:uncharacterized membrane protein YvbJ
MICPKCKTEYREGFTKCDDCGGDLIDEVEQDKQDKPESSVSGKGLSIMTLGIKLLFATFTQILIVIVAYEFYFVYRMSNGGIIGTAIENIHPLIWCIGIIELIISVTIIIWGANFKTRE